MRNGPRAHSEHTPCRVVGLVFGHAAQPRSTPTTLTSSSICAKGSGRAWQGVRCTLREVQTLTEKGSKLFMHRGRTLSSGGSWSTRVRARCDRRDNAWYKTGGNPSFVMQSGGEPGGKTQRGLRQARVAAAREEHLRMSQKYGPRAAQQCRHRSRSSRATSAKELVWASQRQSAVGDCHSRRQPHRREDISSIVQDCSSVAVVDATPKGVL